MIEIKKRLFTQLGDQRSYTGISIFYVTLHATYLVGTLLLPSYLVNSIRKVKYGVRAQTCVLGCARPRLNMFPFNKENFFEAKRGSGELGKLFSSKLNQVRCVVI